MRDQSAPCIQHQLCCKGRHLANPSPQENRPNGNFSGSHRTGDLFADQTADAQKVSAYTCPQNRHPPDREHLPQREALPSSNRSSERSRFGNLTVTDANSGTCGNTYPVNQPRPSHPTSTMSRADNRKLRCCSAGSVGNICVYTTKRKPSCSTRQQISPPPNACIPNRNVTHPTPYRHPHQQR